VGPKDLRHHNLKINEQTGEILMDAGLLQSVETESVVRSSSMFRQAAAHN
jgi:hypothetical protein